MVIDKYFEIVKNEEKKRYRLIWKKLYFNININFFWCFLSI